MNEQGNPDIGISPVETAVRARMAQDADAWAEARALGEDWQRKHYAEPRSLWEPVLLPDIAPGWFILQTIAPKFVRVWQAAFGPFNGGWFEHVGTAYATVEDARAYVRRIAGAEVKP